MSRDQEKDAQLMYDERSTIYDDSWHPRFARHCVELANCKTAEHVLDLACGTGLVSFQARKAVGHSGLVVGVDVSSGMLQRAKDKLTSGGLPNVHFYQHSITDLRTLGAIQDTKFDKVFCVSALVLLPHPGEAIRGWVSYMKPGGWLLVDVTHPDSQVGGMVMERVGRALGKPVMSYRLPFQDPGSLSMLLEAAGLERVTVKAVAQKTIEGSENLEDYTTDLDRPRIEKTYGIGDGDAVFESVIQYRACEPLNEPELRGQAKALFQEEWAKLADKNDKIREVDCVFVGIGQKPT